MSNFNINFLLNPNNHEEQTGGICWAFPPLSSTAHAMRNERTPYFPPPPLQPSHPPPSYQQHQMRTYSPPLGNCPSPLASLTSLSYTCAQVLDTAQQNNHNMPPSKSIHSRIKNGSSPPHPHANNCTPSMPITPAISKNSKKTSHSHEKKKGAMKEMVLEEKYLRMKQSDAAFHLGFAATTFSKRWRASLPKRKWPFRKHVKLLNTIKDLKSMQQRGQDVQGYLAKLMREKKENLQPAVVYFYEKDILERSRGYNEDDEDEDEGADIDDDGEESVFAPNN